MIAAPGRPGVNVVGSCPQPGIRGRPLTPQARLAQAALTRNQAKASTSQEPPRGEHEPGRRKEAVEVEDDDDEEEEDDDDEEEEDDDDEEDERLRKEEDQRAEQRARKKGIRGEAEPESLDQSDSLNPAGNVDEIPESQDDEFEEGKIKEAFRVEEYDGIYLKLGLLLSCEMRLRDASDRAQRMLQRYLVRDGHLFVRRKVGNPRRVCGRNRQIDVVAALHDGIAGEHRGVQATYAKISELYYWDRMMDMVGKFCRSCVPCQERSRLRQGELLHPRLEREVGAVVHLDLLFMPLGDQGYNYIFDARDNLSRFVDGRAIRTKTGSVLGEQRQPGQGLPGQPSATEPRQEPPMGRVILEPEEARAQRQAERETFEFRAPTELATLPVAAAGPVVPLAVDEGLPPSSSEPAQGSAEGSMGVLLEMVHTMQEEVSLFSPEQRIEEPLEREMGIEEEGAIEGRLQRIGTPEYGPEEIEEQPTAVPGAALERRPQRLDTPEYVPATEDLRGRLGFWATGSRSGGPVPGTERQEVVGTAAPQAELQGVISTLAGSPSSPPPQPRKKKFKRKVDQLCFYCKRSAHHALDCLEFLEDKVAGKILEVGGKMYNR
ncbi:hypothetical protein CBR_g6582 [Chara braunii]|uniref:Integrase zinc-binding domain-containing protein n=1 Tax=Chara braunii TaxID=69332 RepID=A0A388KK79_CHABU|nr:hypothetical protein CBR_g6582 [Chara braunii]|eukprot:GBG70454.1 hypothetical protein CBR_g6582 [Chara braunii]